jgi:UPF0755 protein
VTKKSQRHPILIGMVAAAVLMSLSAGATTLWWKNAIAPTQVKSEVVTIQVPEGASADAIGQQLQQAGLIKSLMAWKLWARWVGWQNPQGGFQTGTYELSATDNLPTLADKIWTGKVQQASFTIPEGWTIKEMAAYFEQQGWFSAQAFLEATRKIPREQFNWLPEQIPLIEGFLFPDTYQVPTDQRTPEAVVAVMLKRFEDTALPLFQKQQGSNNLSLLEWVTFSSIVEREAVIPKERPLIAGVFWNRLRQNIALGSDPTVEYGLGIRQTKEQPLTLSQVDTPSPYNTYRNPGLPPTPIGSPGLSSLTAVLTPEKTDYLYFMARYDGTHIFSRTLGEHEQAQDGVRDRVEAEMAQEQESPAPQQSPTPQQTSAPL